MMNPGIRLMHLGLGAHCVSDMTAPPIGKGDLLIASAGPGSFSTLILLLGVVHEAGARMMGDRPTMWTGTPKCRHGRRVASTNQIGEGQKP